MNPADVRLIQQIQQATGGGSRLLITLARRGKVLERDEPERAAFLLTSVGSHPFYKGGRLAFDMLEIEDVMLDAAPTDSMNTFELTQALSAGAHNLVEVLRRIGGDARNGQPDLAGPVLARPEGPEALAATPHLPRVSFGPVPGEVVAAARSPARGGGPKPIRREPELTSSDYLYDYVVLGLLDVLGGIGTSAS